jgi:adenylylsulfate kinase-like enzyme
VNSETLPLLWLCGPPGSGKSTVGFQLYSQLVEAGAAVSYVDIDQLGICFTDRPSDPHRYRLKARNLRKVAAGHQAAGARCVVVSGVVDPSLGVPRDELDVIAVTVGRLRADSEEIVRRYRQRTGSDDGLAETLEEAEQYDASEYADFVIDTTAIAAPEVVRRIREQWQPAQAESARIEVPGDDGAGPILWLCGATGVGKSTVGFPLVLSVVRSGVPAAYLDLDQLGFCGPFSGDRVKAANLAGVWKTFREAGARALVAVGPADPSSMAVYADALPGAAFTTVRLHADAELLAQRIGLRAQGRGSWAQPGDPLAGRSDAQVRAAVERAVGEAESLERNGFGHRIEAYGDPGEIASRIVTDTGWPPLNQPPLNQPPLNQPRPPKAQA